MTILSILMPVYNKANIIGDLISELLEIISGYDCEIIVGDNASTDNTEEVCKSYGDRITYIKNPENIGYDANSYNLLKAANGKYSILIGNGYIFVKENFAALYNFLEVNDYDAVITNIKDRVNFESKTYNDANSFINELGWHIGMMSSILFNKRIIENKNYEKYIGYQFIHSAILYDYILSESVSVYFMSLPTINHYCHKYRSSSWFANAPAYMAKWLELMDLYGDKIPQNLRYKPVSDNAIYTNMFSYQWYKNIINENYNLTVSCCIKYRKIFKYFSRVPWFVVVLLIIPKKIKQLIYKKEKDGNIRKVSILCGLIRFKYSK